MMSATVAASPLNTFASSYEESKNGYIKNSSIIRSTSASVSLVASLLLVWILNRSRSRFSTTYHRLILGMSTFDILYSMTQATFGLVSPAELSYVAWNARGNLTTCDAFGFVTTWGGFAASMYSASLNLFYLAKIKYNKPDSYIARKLEPLLHAVPILYGLVQCTIGITQQGANAASTGNCGPWPYNPPHCDGVEDGQIPDGFNIPCGRGNIFYQGFGAVLMLVNGVMMAFVVPTTIGVSLFMIYRSISRQEQRMMRYGEGALEGDDAGPNNGVTSVSSILTSIMGRIRSRFGGGSGSRNQNSSLSHAVASRATAYSISYSVTYVWLIIWIFMELTGMWPTEVLLPMWAIAYNYFWCFFHPLQGLWIFLIFMLPKVEHARRTSDRDISWPGAFLDALWLAMTGHTMQDYQGTKAISGESEASVASLGAGETNASPAAEEATTTQGGMNTEYSPQPGATHGIETDVEVDIPDITRPLINS